jgi:hypothetical protein
MIEKGMTTAFMTGAGMAKYMGTRRSYSWLKSIVKGGR